MNYNDNLTIKKRQTEHEDRGKGENDRKKQKSIKRRYYIKLRKEQKKTQRIQKIY